MARQDQQKPCDPAVIIYPAYWDNKDHQTA